MKRPPGRYFSDAHSLALFLSGVLEEHSPEIVAGRMFQGASWESFAPDRILCLGKAAPGLAAAAAGRWPRAKGLVYSAGGGVPLQAGYEGLVGDHPFPTEGNVERTAAVRRWLEGGRGPVLACVSGGASALLVEPLPPWTLQEKLAVAAALWKAGATIRELNAVRAALSGVKAGGLLSSAGTWPLRTAVWSDVGPGDAVLVGSAPTIPWRPSPSAARVARRYGVVPPRPLASPRRADAKEARWEVLFDAAALRRACASRLRSCGYAVREVAQPEGEGAEALAARIVRRWSAAPPGRPRALVGCGEAVVPAAPGEGPGGRCSHLAAAVAGALTERSAGGPWAFAALATDGVDGSGGGGAFVDSRRCPPRGQLGEALLARRTADLWEPQGCLVPRKPTGNNLRDLWVLADFGD